MTTLLELPVRHNWLDAQVDAAHGATTSPQAKLSPLPNSLPPEGTHSTDRGQHTPEAQNLAAPVGPDFPASHEPADAHHATAGGEPNSETGANQVAPPNPTARPSLFDPTLSTIAALLDDIEGNRKAHANRVRILTTHEPDEDGVIRGFGLDETHPAVAILTGLGDQLATLEHETILALQRAMRKHPLAQWQKQAKGVGEKQLARLLASVGDPRSEERRVGKECRSRW